jgi:hypothetical protein
MGRKVERYLNFSGAGIRVESPTLAAINTCRIEHVKARALCDRHRCDPPGFSIDVANEYTFPFRSVAAGERRIFGTWCVSRHTLWFGTQD